MHGLCVEDPSIMINLTRKEKQLFGWFEIKSLVEVHTWKNEVTEHSFAGKF